MRPQTLESQLRMSMASNKHLDKIWLWCNYVKNIERVVKILLINLTSSEIDFIVSTVNII